MLVCVRHFISFFFLRLSNFKRILLPLLLCSIPLFLAYTTVLRCYSLFIVVASRSACCTFSFHLCLLAGVNRKLYNFSCFIFTMTTCSISDTTCSISDRKKKEERRQRTDIAFLMLACVKTTEKYSSVTCQETT